MFVISPYMASLIEYDMNSFRLTEDVIPTVFDKLGDAIPKRISSFMEKLNIKRVCMSDNKAILGANYWTLHSTVHAFVNKVKIHLFAKLLVAVYCRQCSHVPTSINLF